MVSLISQSLLFFIQTLNILIIQFYINPISEEWVMNNSNMKNSLTENDLKCGMVAYEVTTLYINTITL